MAKEKNGLCGPEGRFMSSVKVGPKGQIVIPKEVREMFDIHPGSTLVLMADPQRGIALQRQEVLDAIARQVFATMQNQSAAEFVEAVEQMKEP